MTNSQASVALAIPPHSTEAEQAVVGGLLLDNHAVHRVADLISPCSFYRTEHRLIFDAILQLTGDRQPADVLTVAEYLASRGEGDRTGGLAYLGQMASNTPSAANVRRYAEIVREKAILRAMLAISSELASSCFSPAGKGAAEIAAAAEKALGDLQAGIERGDTLPWSVVASESVSWLRKLTAGGQLRLGTGISDLDAILGGLHAGQLVVIAARPSVGKTALALNVLDHVCRRGFVGLLFSLEMTRTEIGARVIGLAGGRPAKHLCAGESNAGSLDQTVDRLIHDREYRLHVNDHSTMAISYLSAKARQVRRQEGRLDLVVIDYLQLLHGKGENRTEQVGSISRGLKRLAKDLGCPVLALAQLNRAVEHRSDRRPQLSDLRGSGEIEQDADVVLMLHRESMVNDNPKWQGVAELIVRKHRNGPLGDVLLDFNPEIGRFSASSRVSPRAPSSRGGDGQRRVGFPG